MKYKEFKKIIDNVEIVNEKIYNQLVDKYGNELIDNFFDIYISELDLEEDIDIVDKFKYFFDMVRKNDEEEKVLDVSLNSDIVSSYLIEIGNTPLLTAEEESNVCQKISQLKRALNKKGITLDNINEELNKLGYESRIDNNTVFGLENKRKYLIQKKEEAKNSNLLMISIDEILNNLNHYLEYQKLIEKFINANLRLVVSIAKKYINCGLDFMDLIQEGNAGLRKGLDKFDVEKGYKFSTYATWWIRQNITRYIYNNSRSMRLPIYASEKINRLTKARYCLAQELNRVPSDEEIALKLNISVDEVKRITNFSRKTVSLESQINVEEDDELGSIIPSDDCTEDEAIRNTENIFLRKSFINLTDREKLIILLRFGLKLDNYLSIDEFLEMFMSIKPIDFDIDVFSQEYNKICREQKEYTLEEVGQMLGITRERIRQLESKAKRKIEKSLIKSGITGVNG